MSVRPVQGDFLTVPLKRRKLDGVDPLAEKTAEAARNTLTVPPRTSMGSKEVETRQLVKESIQEIQSGGRRFEFWVFQFIEFISRSKKQSLSVANLKSYCGTLCAAAEALPNFAFQFGRINWNELPFDTITASFRDLSFFLKKCDSKSISHRKLSREGFALGELCKAIKDCTRESSEDEYRSAEPLEIRLTDPFGKETLIGCNRSQIEAAKGLVEIACGFFNREHER